MNPTILTHLDGTARVVAMKVVWSLARRVNAF